MQISLNWLSDYVDIKNIPAQDIATALTDIGLEVETIETQSSLKGEVVVGDVLEASKHPDADSLQVCKVNIGSGDPLEIVCGAPNARAGIRVCVARVGSVLPKDFKIKKSKIRGVTSFGMLCAEDELGISDNHDEIIELAADTPLGSSVAELYGLSDTVLTLGVTPNRSDCFGYLGVARDLAAKLELPLKSPLPDPGAGNPNLKSSDCVKVTIENPDDCPRFCVLRIEGLKNTPSPLWMRSRLEAAGMRPLNLIVDVTNYVMLEFGQPIHAYDERDVKDQCFVVRRAKAGETLQTLDEQERNLTTDDLLICDSTGPIGLAGVMGGANSEVKGDTSAVLVEVASFHPGLIRKTAKRFGLHTEASHRFERGTDSNAVATVAWRVAELYCKLSEELGLAKPRVAIDAVDEYPSPFKPAKIAMRLSRARQVLGMPVLDANRSIDLLERIGIVLLDRTEDNERILFQIPSWRHDISREIDLIEEVGRLIGFDQITLSLPMMEIGTLAEKPFSRTVEDARRVAAQIGLTETINFPFASAADFDSLQLPKDHIYRQALMLENPLADDQNYMQPSLLIGLLNTLRTNKRHGRRRDRLFEVGRGYLASTTEKAGYLAHLQEEALHLNARAVADDRPREKTYFCAVIDQEWTRQSWQSPKAEATSMYHGKFLVKRFLSAFGINELNFDPNVDAMPFLHPKKSAIIESDGEVLGYVGQLHPKTASAYDFDVTSSPVAIEINIDRLYRLQTKPKTYLAEPLRFPPVTRDMAFLVDGDKQYADFDRALRDFPKRRHLRNFHLFDVYSGDKIDASKKSFAFALEFQSPKRTLSDKDVEQEIELLKTHLAERLGAEQR